MTRRKFLGTTLASGATLVAGGSSIIFTTNSLAMATKAESNSVFRLGGDLPVNRLGSGAMRISGEGIWGWRAERGEALKVLRRRGELGVNLIDTAYSHGSEARALLVAEGPHAY